MSKVTPEIVHRRIEYFTKRFGKGHLYLAYHAAFPLALKPDLLYSLWANFQQDIHGKVLGIPWIAVADILLSSLCDEVGYELYEMDLAVRKELLSRLKDEPDFGQQRLDELAKFLLNYTRQQLLSDDPDVQDFAQVQQWNALTYVRPNQAASELALALSKLDRQQDKAELLRLASLTETLAEPLAEFEPLLIYARGMASWVHGDLEGANTEFAKIPIHNNHIEVGGVILLVPERITQTNRRVKLTPKTQVNKSENQKIRNSILKIFNQQLPPKPNRDFVFNFLLNFQKNPPSSPRLSHQNATINLLLALLLTSVSVSAVIWGMRELKWLQRWELNAYDSMLRLRTPEKPDPRIVIVTINETDLITTKWPLPDKIINQLLTKIESFGSRVIGLNIYRPEQKNFGAGLKNPQQLIGLCKMSTLGNPAIPPPANFPISNIGFSDVIADEDGILRRALLFASSNDKKCTSYFSFASLLAIDYLKKQNIDYKFLENNNFQLGKIIFPQLTPDSGSYENLDAGGYQILLNYRHPNRLARKVTLTQVLNNQVKPEIFKDKLVIIGTTAASVHLGFYTPYSASPNHPARMPAVLIHAQIASQLISDVLDGRSLIRYWPQWVETLWVWGWSLAGSFLAWQLRYSWKLVFAGMASLICLVGICVYSFVQAVWIPVIPPALALVFSALVFSALVIYGIKVTFYTKMHE
ncbi:MAG: CHASE2 domain-containing protein [Calothrix sp. MO_167.B12]|nr:CHASE2 domain-containing protein [Calothrix sp. MO_167.B12]